METTLAGRYRLQEVVGRGGMSTVYRATDEILGRTVAVKVLLATLADQDPTYSVRFEREARAAAALGSSAVVTVYDTGVDSGSHFIVMEYIEGQSLEEMLRSGRPLEVAEALRIASRVADALAAAHAAGILHRDIKPGNVMAAEDGAVKVLDFGIARRLDGTTITQAASVVGTAAYIAPERALGQPGDARADIYSLGCLLYAMLIGQPPFGGEISAAILHQQINAAPRPLREQRDGVSPALDALVLAMLAKSPQARPATVQAVRDELANLAGAGPIAPTAVTVPPTNSTEPTAVAVPPTNSTAPTAALASAVGATSATAPLRPARSYRHSLLADHRRRAVLMAVLTGVVALIAVAVLGAGGSGSSDSASGHRQTNPAVRQHTSAVANPASTKPSGPKPAHPSTGAPPGQGGAPPGHGGEPPGQAKKSKHDKKAKKAKP